MERLKHTEEPKLIKEHRHSSVDINASIARLFLVPTAAALASSIALRRSRSNDGIQAAW
jgi:hypothetical protein